MLQRRGVIWPRLELRQQVMVLKISDKRHRSLSRTRGSATSRLFHRRRPGPGPVRDPCSLLPLMPLLCSFISPTRHSSPLLLSHNLSSSPPISAPASQPWPRIQCAFWSPEPLVLLFPLSKSLGFVSIAGRYPQCSFLKILGLDRDRIREFLFTWFIRSLVFLFCFDLQDKLGTPWCL